MDQRIRESFADKAISKTVRFAGSVALLAAVVSACACNFDTSVAETDAKLRFADAGTSSDDSDGGEGEDAGGDAGDDAGDDDRAVARSELASDAGCTALATTVEATLTSYCTGCHANGKSEGDFSNVLDVAELIASGKVVPEQPDDSLLYVFVETRFMPRTENKPTTEEIAALREWIECGAPHW